MKRRSAFGVLGILVLGVLVNCRAADTDGQDQLSAGSVATRTGPPSALAGQAMRVVASGARVQVPETADAAFRIEAPDSTLVVSYQVDGAEAVRASNVDGALVYANAILGGNLIVRSRDDGVEEFVALSRQPTKEQLSYRIDVKSVKGLRLVANVLEFLDETGTPRLRVPAPQVVDADKRILEAKIALHGCRYDANPAPPWGRAVTAPGAAACTMRVSWAGLGVKYPAMVDPAWTSTGNLTMAHYEHQAVLLASGRVLVLGGGTFSASAKAELYDPATKTFSATGTMGTARYWCSATRLGTGKVLVTGGNATNNSGLQSAEIYDAVAGTFASTGNMATTRARATATLLPSGRVLVAGGGTNTAELFNPSAAAGVGAFSTTGNMSSQRVQHTATALSTGKVLVAAGCPQGGCAGTTLNTAEIFDETASGGVGAFSATGTLGTARYDHSAVLLADGRVLVAGGSLPFALIGQSLEVFDPASAGGVGAFTDAGKMVYDRNDFATVLLGSGKVLAVGGHGFNTATGIRATAELIDLSAAPPSKLLDLTLGDHRFGLSATLLASGAVLIASGGNDISGNSLGELFSTVATGGTCVEQADCASGVCVDGICCAGACAGACRTCTAGAGACVAVVNADDPDTCAGAMSCDAVGSCKLKNANKCALDTECASGHCSDAVCCDKACSGTCDACNVAASVGTCTLLGAGDPGQGATCAPFLCSGASATCPSTCSTDANCASGDYCAKDGTCKPQKAQGATCNTAAGGADCKTAGCRACPVACVDGVCCDTACDGACQACSVALKGVGAGGVCGNASVDTDPHNTCAPDPGFPASCGADGLCDGTGACRVHAKAGVGCSSPICIANAASQFQCNGFGSCLQAQPLECGAEKCIPGTGCTTPSDGGTDAGADAATPQDSGANLPDAAPDASGVVPPVAEAGANPDTTPPTDGAGDSSGGCALTRPSTTGEGGGAWLLLGLAAVTVLRSRRGARGWANDDAPAS